MRCNKGLFPDDLVAPSRGKSPVPDRKLGLVLGVVVMIAAVITAAASAPSGTVAVEPQVIDDSQLQALTTTIGGASVLPTTRTVPHWWGSTLDSHNGVTYGYNMVGADPNNCSGSDCSVTVEADITPLIVNIDGLTFSGNNSQPNWSWK